jgi:hypothetical protein
VTETNFSRSLELISHDTIFLSHNKIISADLSAAETVRQPPLGHGIVSYYATINFSRGLRPSRSIKKQIRSPVGIYYLDYSYFVYMHQIMRGHEQNKHFSWPNLGCFHSVHLLHCPWRCPACGALEFRSHRLHLRTYKPRTTPRLAKPGLP